MHRHHWRKLSNIFVVGMTQGSSGTLALSVSMGMTIGFLPKDNLLVLTLVASLFFVPVKPLVVMTSFCLAWWMTPSLDPIAHRVGGWMLENPTLQGAWTLLASWPVMPWLRWNNSVVMGGLILGMSSALPCYGSLGVSRWLIQRLRRRYRRRRYVSEKEYFDEAEDIVVEVRGRRDKLSTAKVTATEKPMKSMIKRATLRHRIDPIPIIMTPGSNLEPEHVKSRQPTEGIENRDGDSSEMPAAVLQETVIEVVRYRPNGQTIHPQAREMIIPKMHSESSVSTPSMSSSTPSVERPTAPKLLTRPSSGAFVVSGAESTASLGSRTIDPSLEKPREEALRYLLWHLSGAQKHPPIKDQAS